MKYRCSCFFILIITFLYGCTDTNQTLHIVRQTAERYNQQILKAPYIAPAAYVETATCGGSYCMYTESYGYLHSSGYKDIMIPVDNFAFLSKNTKKSGRKPEWLEGLKNYYALGQVSYQSDFIPGYNSAFSAFRWIEERGPLSNMDLFEFEIIDAGDYENDQNSQIQIQFTPISQIDQHTYSGTLFVDPDTFSIHQLVLDNCRFYSRNLARWVSAKGIITYEPDSEFDYVSKMSFEYQESDIEYKLLITSLFPLEVWERVDDKEYINFLRQDSNPMVIYNPDNWNPPVKFQDVNYEKISMDLLSEESLETQFTKNSDVPFYPVRLDYQDKPIPINGGQDTYDYVEQKILEFDNMFNFYQQ